MFPSSFFPRSFFAGAYFPPRAGGNVGPPPDYVLNLFAGNAGSVSFSADSRVTLIAHAGNVASVRFND